MSSLTHDPIRAETLISRVSGPERGGVASFVGLVRNHHRGKDVTRLSYSAYEPMAEAVGAEILLEAETRWGVRVAMQHRLGELTVGDVAVAIAAAGHHRDEAFQACRYVIEELKRRVPIWKQEWYADGTVEWVNPQQGAGSGEREAGIREQEAGDPA